VVTLYRRLPKFEYLRPTSLQEALSLLAQYKGKARLLAGGTDLVPKLKRREIEAPSYLIDIKSIAGLDYIRHDEVEGLKIGALATIHAIETSPIIKERFPVLAQAAYSMASVQVRNRATVAGNICNAVPSADTAPALLTLQARVKLASQKGERWVDIEDFFTGPKETVLTDEEMLLEIEVPNLPLSHKGIYLKLSPRRSMDLAVVGVAVVAVPENGVFKDVFKDVRIALGAVAPTPIRARRAEEVLRGQSLNEELIKKAAQIAEEEARPIDDHRASAWYRKKMVNVLVKRALQQIIS